MNEKWQTRALEILDNGVKSGEENSLQFCVYKDGECVVDACAGWLDFEKKKAVDLHTIFPIYSTSKGVPATALTRLIEQGAITPETLIADIWPEFAQNGKEGVKLIHILNHTTGLPQRLPSQTSYELVADWSTMIHDIEQSATDWVPGTQARYQSLTYGWLTAEVIQRVTGRTFREYVQTELFEPENIEDFYFGTTDEAEKNAAEIKLKDSETKSKSASICDPLDDLMRVPIIRKAALPGFNGISSAHALAKFYNAVINNRYFSAETLERATSYKVDPNNRPGCSTFNTFAWGYALSGPINDVGRVFGHGGYGGADAIVDKAQRLTIGFTNGMIGPHPCKGELFKLVNLVQREGWEQ